MTDLSISPALLGWLARPESIESLAHQPRQRVKTVKIRAFIPHESAVNQPDRHSTDRLNIQPGPPIFDQMVEYLDMTFAALADATRRGMLADLMQGERTIGALAAPHAMSFAGAAKHVAVLERAGLIERRKAGREQLCRVKAARLAEAQAWLKQWETFWSQRLDALAALVEEEQERAK